MKTMGLVAAVVLGWGSWANAGVFDDLLPRSVTCGAFPEPASLKLKLVVVGENGVTFEGAAVDGFFHTYFNCLTEGDEIVCSGTWGRDLPSSLRIARLPSGIFEGRMLSAFGNTRVMGCLPSHNP